VRCAKVTYDCLLLKQTPDAVKLYNNQISHQTLYITSDTVYYTRHCILHQTLYITTDTVYYTRHYITPDTVYYTRHCISHQTLYITPDTVYYTRHYILYTIAQCIKLNTSASAHRWQSPTNYRQETVVQDPGYTLIQQVLSQHPVEIILSHDRCDVVCDSVT